MQEVHCLHAFYLTGANHQCRAWIQGFGETWPRIPSAHGVYLHSSVDLISGASVVTLVPRPMESWAGPRDKATVLLCETTLAAPRAPRLALYFVLGLCSFCYAVSAARHAQSRSILRFLVVRRVFRGSLQEHDDSISKIPAALLRDHHTNYPIDPHWVQSVTMPTNSYTCIFKFSQHNYWNKYLWYDIWIHTYIHTYIHTDTACVQHVNVGLAQAHPN